MTTRQRNIAITPEGWAAATEKQRAERAAVPQFVAMDAAMELTKDEKALLAAADAKVTEAKAAVGAAGVALKRAERGMDPTPAYDKSKPFSFFLKSPATYKAAKASLPGLKADVEEARTHHQNAIRRRNATERSINLARAERRRAAKAKHAPKREPVKSQGDKWMALGMGRKDAA